jgi:hypothetical protein
MWQARFFTQARALKQGRIQDLNMGGAKKTSSIEEIDKDKTFSSSKKVQCMSCN